MQEMKGINVRLTRVVKLRKAKKRTGTGMKRTERKARSMRLKIC